MLLAVAATHRLSTRESVGLTELRDEMFVDFLPGRGMRDANDQAFAAAEVPREAAYEINNATTVLGFVRHGPATGMILATIRRTAGVDDPFAR